MSRGKPHPVDIEVGARLRAFRESAGVTQSDLGRAIGVTFQQVQKYETGANRVSSSRLSLAAGHLGVPVASFFDDVTPNDCGVAPAFRLLAVSGAPALLEAFGRLSPRQRRLLVDVAQAIPSRPST